MASTSNLFIIPPVHFVNRIGLDTEQKLREAIESISRGLIDQGLSPFTGNEHRWFAWKVSPTFNGFVDGDLIISNSCLRTEAVFIGYAFAIWTINSAHAELRAISVSRDEAQKTSSVYKDVTDMSDMCNRLYLAYLILVDVVKGNLILWNQRTHPYESAEYYTETTNVLINICAALHTIAFVEYGQSNKAIKLSKTTWARLFLFIAIRFERAYFLLTDFVWVMYGGNHPSAISLQRICLGYILYYRAKTYILCLSAIMEDPKRDVRTNRMYNSSEMIMALAQRSVYLLTPLITNIHFGFSTRSQKLIAYAEQMIRENYLSVRPDSITRKRITNADEYDKLESIVSEVIKDEQARNMLRVKAQTNKHNFHFVPDEDFGNYDGFMYHAIEMPEIE